MRVLLALVCTFAVLNCDGAPTPEPVQSSGLPGDTVIVTDTQTEELPLPPPEADSSSSSETNTEVKQEPCQDVLCPSPENTCVAELLCDPSTGLCTRSRYHTAGSPCDDQDPCTEHDTCQGTGTPPVCAGTPIPVDDNNVCTIDTCAGGQAKHSPSDGIPCTPNSPCSSTGVCGGGLCKPDPPCECITDADCPNENLCDGYQYCDKSDGAPKCMIAAGSQIVCTSDNVCFQSICEPTTGDCIEYPSLPGTSCDDGDACTLDDKCTQQECTGYDMDCNDGKECTIDGCDPNGGCIYQSYLCCGNGELDPQEQCDDDNQIDGDGCNANCQVEPSLPPYITPFKIRDFDISNDGTLAASGTNIWTGLHTIWLQCFGPDQTVIQPSFPMLDNNSLPVYRAYVSRSPVSGITATASFIHLAPFSDPDYAVKTRVVFRLFDAECAPLTLAIHLNDETSAHREWDLDIDDMGRSIVVWSETTPCKGCPGATMRTRMAGFDPEGAQNLPATTVGPNTCPGAGVHVAMNQATGSWIVTCQGETEDPIFYQRFSAEGAPMDALMMAVEHTENGGSSYGDTHAVGMHRDGSFAILWVNATSKQYQANLYGTNGTLTASVVVGAIENGKTHTQFDGIHAVLESPDGEFVLPYAKDGSNGFMDFVRYSPEGEVLLAGEAFEPLRMLRIDAEKSTYVYSDQQSAVLKDVVKITP